jgi:hypothetical protein
MGTNMIRKQIYIRKHQDELLKRLAKARGLSEAEIIRQAIERESGGTSLEPLSDSVAAWQEIVQFLENRRQKSKPGKPYRWNREEIYAERANRWLRDRSKD